MHLIDFLENGNLVCSLCLRKMFKTDKSAELNSKVLKGEVSKS